MRRALARALDQAWNGPEVRELLSRAADQEPGDALTLASLTSAHLLAFAGDEQAPLDSRVAEAWFGLSPPDRWRVRRAGLDSFRTKQWLGWDGPEDAPGRRLRVDPHLALIMRARSRPRFVVTVHFQDLPPTIRGYAVGARGDVPECFLAEVPDNALTMSIQGRDNPFHWCYRYFLMARGNLVQVIAELVAGRVGGGSEFSDEPRIVSLYAPPVLERNLISRFEVRPGRDPGDLEALVAGFLPS